LFCWLFYLLKDWSKKAFEMADRSCFTNASQAESGTSNDAFFFAAHHLNGGHFPSILLVPYSLFLIPFFPLP